MSLFNNENVTKVTLYLPLGVIAKGLFLLQNFLKKEGAVKMWIEYQPNPCGRNVGDCAVRAISIALNIDWETAYMMLANAGLLMCEIMNANSVISAVLREHGFYKKAISDKCPECYTVEEFCADHPVGIFVLGTGVHTVAVIDGNYIDSFDSGKETPVYYYYRP